jgi:effector-binding domain-containing protein
MKVSKKIIVGLSIILSLFLVWYLFIKESDYTISFKINTSTGTVFQGVQEWSTAQAQKGNENYAILEKENFDFIKYEIRKGDSQFYYAWNIKSVNDSVTKIDVSIKELNHSLYNKISAPFFNTKFKQEQIEKIISFKKALEEHLKVFKVKIDGEGTSEGTFVAYINLKSVLQEKAQSMIQNDASITGYLQKNNIKIIGRPFVEVQNWDFDSEKLDFNYCFPVEKRADFPPSSVVKFKTLPALKGLKATYFGNFRTSDRAWFALLDYAKRHDYKLSNKPLEHFLANPFNGGEEIEWETQIIVPFDQK